MPRVGHHPLKVRGLKIDYKPKEITITTIVYIPALEGYWAESLDVLKLFFNSLFQNTSLPFDLMVLDNGSCPEVLDYLQQLRAEKKIQYLLLSEYNLRKPGGLNLLLSAAPGEIISYADSDVYFLPGWLEASLEVLHTFPKVGKVTAQPLVAGDVPSQQRDFLEELKREGEILIQTGLLIPEDFVRTWMHALGRKYNAEIDNQRSDVLLTKKGISAFLTGSDFQFTTTRVIIQPFLPLDVRHPDGSCYPFYSRLLEESMIKAGYQFYSTKDYLVHHMGNRLPSLKDELPWRKDLDNLVIAAPRREQVRRSPILSRLLERKRVRDLLKKLNIWSYKLLFER